MLVQTAQSRTHELEQALLVAKSAATSDLQRAGNLMEETIRTLEQKIVSQVFRVTLELERIVNLVLILNVMRQGVELEKRTEATSRLEGERLQLMQQNAVLLDHVHALDPSFDPSSQTGSSAPARISRSNGAAQSPQPAALLQELDALRAENAALKTELSAFDASFFDEIEELKYRYGENLRLLSQYEQANTALTQQLATLGTSARGRGV